MKNTIFKNNLPKSGFTILELVAVITVIGILTAISVLSYGNWRQNLIVSQLKSDLSAASSAMENARNFGSGYPTNLSTLTTFTQNPDVPLTLAPGSNPDGKSYCIDATSTKDATLHYHVDNIQGVQIGTCPDPWANWYSGIAAPALAGKHVYKTDLGSTMQYKTTYDAVVSPQGATGLDPNYPSNMSLVSPQTNTGVDFSVYPAQNACKAISGRLPNMQELIAIYAGRSSYGNNFQWAYYWSSTESPSNWAAYLVNFRDGSTDYDTKSSYFYVRCVSG